MPFPVDLALIHESGRQLGRKLPMDLRVRLHRENGAEVRALGDMWRLFPVFDASDRRRIARTANHIVRETQVARERAGLPEGSIAIAEDGSGYLLIVRAGSDEVEFWDHETSESRIVEVD
jgi:hypothetical protein